MTHFLRGTAWAASGLLCGLGLAALVAYAKTRTDDALLSAAADLAVDILPVLGLAAGLLIALTTGRRPPVP